MVKEKTFNPFYSTHARVVISNFEVFRNLIKDYLSEGTKRKVRPKRFGGGNNFLSEDEVLEALENAETPDFLRSIMDIIAETTRTKKSLATRQTAVQNDIEITKRSLLNALQASSNMSIQELQDLYKILGDQDALSDSLMAELESASINSWLTRLNEIIKRHRQAWQKHMEGLAKELSANIASEFKIPVREIEQNEITKPTKTKVELIAEIKKLPITKFLEKDATMMDAFHLKVIWLVGSAHAAAHVTTLDLGAIKNFINRVVTKEAVDCEKILAEHQKDYEELIGDLNKIRSQIRTIIPLTNENRQRMVAALSPDAIKQLKVSKPEITFEAPILD